MINQNKSSTTVYSEEGDKILKANCGCSSDNDNLFSQSTNNYPNSFSQSTNNNPNSFSSYATQETPDNIKQFPANSANMCYNGSNNNRTEKGNFSGIVGEVNKLDNQEWTKSYIDKINEFNQQSLKDYKDELKEQRRQLDTTIKDVNAKLETKLDRIDEKFDRVFDLMSSNHKEMYSLIDTKIGYLDQKIDRKIDSLSSQISSDKSEIISMMDKREDKMLTFLENMKVSQRNLVTISTAISSIVITVIIALFNFFLNR